MIQDIIESIFGSRRKKTKSAPHKIKLRLETLEDRVVPTYIWSPVNPSIYSQFGDAANWLDTTTGQTATKPPDPTTDCYFSATSPTICGAGAGICRSITTDVNWHGDIVIGSSAALTTVGGNSSIRGGDIVCIEGGNDIATEAGYINAAGGTFDYDSPNLNENSSFQIKPLTILTHNGAAFTVDKNCLNINANFMIGSDIDGLDSPGTLILNSNTRKSPNTTIIVSPLGQLIYFTPPPPSTLVWNGTTDTNWNNPNNWIDPTTGQVSASAPGSNTDCIFSVTSPTTCTVTGDISCKSITTDVNWNGDIDVSSSILSVYGGTSTIKGGTITSNNSDGTLEVNGGTFDYDGQNINETSLSRGGFLSINIDNNASFTVDKDCTSTNGGMNIDAHFKVGMNVDGRTNSPGTLTFNTPIGSSGQVAIVSNRINIEVSPQGTVVFAPNSVLTSRLSDQANGLNSLGTVIIDDGAVLALRQVNIEGGIFKTARSGSATIGESYGTGVDISNATFQMNSDQGNYFQLNLIGFLNLGNGSTFEYHVDGGQLSASNRITVKQDDATERGFFALSGHTTSICDTDESKLLPGNHNYTIIDTTSTSLSGQFSNLLWNGNQPTVWQTTYQPNGFSLSGTILPPVHSFLWKPTSDTFWSNPNNWFDMTTGATATFAPNDHTDVNFNAASAWEYCRINSTANCRSIHIASGPNHLLDLSGGTLEVFGVNGADSDIEGGEIDCVVGPVGKLEVNGGNFTYNAPTLNHPFIYPVNLEVLTFGGADFTIGPNCVTTYNTIYSAGSLGDNGTITVNTTGGKNYSFVNSSINVGSKGTLVFDSFATLSNVAVTSYGNVILNNGDILYSNGSSASSMLIEGGTLQNKGIGYIQGNVLIYNASLELVDDPVVPYTMNQFIVNGNLTMINGSFGFHVFADDPYASDHVFANTITLFGSCTSNCTTVGDALPSYSSYYFPMTTFSNQFNGTFSTYNWLGTGKTWTPNYANGQYQLLG